MMDVHEIRYGYNLADLHEIAMAAVKRGSRSWVVPANDLYEAAWSAIAECLCTAEEPPTSYELIGTGMKAVSEAIRQGERCHGWDRDAHRTRPLHVAYWTDYGGPTQSPEDRIVDRTALWQIWPTLSRGRRDALLALATCGDYQAAADFLGLNYKAFHQRIRDARLVFLEAWHEGETPSGMWSADRRRWRDGRRVRQRRLADHASIKSARNSTTA
ncbi:hypothetical protein ACFOY4_01650 [Actinomadura syzygii]|uniref:Uncharacterized protein n=1 Tax=Actinomadura syzygii TaxID=1427538 RepID=A0A5D0TS77_9ACTN|nr:hypothetical protein [Actinomadura syzygii]TYC08553.1 hypothetical protein FXF65_37290 [Actinomadura syzygii]